jgi:hypothetical protein
MKELWRRIRAAIKMGLTWGFAWSAAGGILARVPGVSSDLPFPLLFAGLGFITGIIFSGVLVSIESRRSDRVSLPRMALWGAVSGLLLTGIFVAGAALRGANVWAEFVVFGPALTLAGAACASGTLALARRAEQTELPGPGEDLPGSASHVSGGPAKLLPRD